jgi:hypothetical protein
MRGKGEDGSNSRNNRNRFSWRWARLLDVYIRTQRAPVHPGSGTRKARRTRGFELTRKLPNLLGVLAPNLHADQP